MKDGKGKYRYYKIYQDIKNKIDSGDLSQGQRLPTETQLQEQYSVSRDTVRKSLMMLDIEGYIVKRPALGTFVRSEKSNYMLSSMTSFTEQMKNRGIKPSSELIGINLTDSLSQDIRDMLHIGGSEKCYIITRIRKGNDFPMAYEKTYVPCEVCPDLHKYIDREASLYEIYERIYNHKIGQGDILLEAMMPNTEIQNALKISKESPVLYMKCLGLMDNGNPLYYVDCYYIGDKYVFSTTVIRNAT